mmetsp:Transcript_7985/g.9036  ORF Transcript_7985/g.9036 Transcript_7985/m.9036 type:complete len:186 (+) Transcript_7985:173-730(+)
MPMNKTSKMLQYVNYRMRVTIQDSRTLVGTFLAFDRHMNLVLADCEEFRKLKTKKGSGGFEEKEEKRTLGLVLLRGENVVSLQVEAPPQTSSKPTLPQGTGRGVPAGRGMGMPMPMPGLTGPVRGLGGPAPGSMQPSAAAPPMGMGMGMGVPPPGMGMGRGMPPLGMGMPPPGMGRGAPRGPPPM